MFDINTTKTLDVFSFEVKGEPKGLGLVINGKPYLLWNHVYQNLELARNHARKLILSLDEGTHYITFSHEQLTTILTRGHATCTLNFSVPTYYFISQEGFNRAIMEVDDDAR